jgi:hypothetical protein
VLRLKLNHASRSIKNPGSQIKLINEGVILVSECGCIEDKKKIN